MLSLDTANLETAYKKFNDYFFEGKLPEVAITIQSSRGAYGHCTTQKVWASTDGSKDYYELNIGAEHLNRPIENVLATLVHEMVHIYCMEVGLKDTSNGGRYHNSVFKAEGEKRGLILSKHGYIGWSVTSPGQMLIEAIDKLDLRKMFTTYRTGFRYVPGMSGDNNNNTSGGTTNVPGNNRKPSSTRKYICLGCGISCRATKNINIKCMDCDMQMVIDS